MLGVNVGIGVPGRRRGGFRPPPGNVVVNWRGTGGTVGVLGAGGVAPTGMTLQSVAGVTLEILSFRQYRGITLTTLKISGVPSLLAGATLFGGPNVAGNYDGLTTTFGFFHRIVAGSLVNFGAGDAGYTARAFNGGGPVSTPLATPEVNRVDHAILAGAGSTNLRPQLRYTHPDTVRNIDLTLEFGGFTQIVPV